MSQRLILFGGGLDSGFMVAKSAQYNHSIRLLFFNYGQKAVVGERYALDYFSTRYAAPATEMLIPQELIPASPLTGKALATDHAQNEIPGRNLLFMTLGYSFALREKWGNEIWLGASPRNPFRDSQQPIVDSFNAMTAHNYGIDTPRVRAPLLLFPSKESYVREGVALLPELFAVTFSCYESREAWTECGRCVHCLQKKEMHTSILGPLA